MKKLNIYTNTVKLSAFPKHTLQTQSDASNRNETNNSPYFDESLVVDSFLSCSKISETSFIHTKICV